MQKSIRCYSILLTLFFVAISGLLTASTLCAAGQPNWGGAPKNSSPPIHPRTRLVPFNSGSSATAAGITFSPSVWKMTAQGSSGPQRQAIQVTLGIRKLGLRQDQIWANLDIVSSSRRSVKNAFQGRVKVTGANTFSVGLVRVGPLSVGDYFLTFHHQNQSQRLTTISVAPNSPAPAPTPPPVFRPLIQDVLFVDNGTFFEITFFLVNPAPSSGAEIRWFFPQRPFMPNRGTIQVAPGLSQISISEPFRVRPRRSSAKIFVTDGAIYNNDPRNAPVRVSFIKNFTLSP